MEKKGDIPIISLVSSLPIDLFFPDGSHCLKNNARFLKKKMFLSRVGSKLGKIKV